MVKAIELHDVDLSLGRGAARVHILKGISLAVERGEAVGLVGPSGSGKSTLLMTMAGLERPDSGSVRIDGEDLGPLDEDQLARFRGRRIGIVFQSFHLLPTMTALENVAVPLELAGAPNAFARAKEELQAVGLGERLTPLSRATLGRRAAARRPRPRAGAGPDDPGGRRAHRKSRREHRRADRRPALRHEARPRRDTGAGDARRIAGPALRPDDRAAVRRDRRGGIEPGRDAAGDGVSAA